MGGALYLSCCTKTKLKRHWLGCSAAEKDRGFWWITNSTVKLLQRKQILCLVLDTIYEEGCEHIEEDPQESSEDHQGFENK